MKKSRIIILICAIVLLCTGFCFAESKAEVQAADELYELGLFKGTGTKNDGSPEYSLDNIPTRQEAITMLVRLLGKEDEALALSVDIPFDDVDEWCIPYVNYGYQNGLTNGVSDTKFGSAEKVSEAQYLTFILRALGYSDANGDFKWDESRKLADSLGLTSDELFPSGAKYTRGSLARVSDKALNIKLKDSSITLFDKLQDEGVIAGDKILFADLWQAYGDRTDPEFIENPQKDVEFEHNFLIAYILGDWEYANVTSDSAAWKEIGPTMANRYIALLGAFQNQYSCWMYVDNNDYYIALNGETGLLTESELEQEMYDAYLKAAEIYNSVHSSNSSLSSSKPSIVAEAYYDYLVKYGRIIDESTLSKSYNIRHDSAYACLVNRNGACGACAAGYCILMNLEDIPNAGVLFDNIINGSLISGHVMSYILIDAEEKAVDWGNKLGFLNCDEDILLSDGSKFVIRSESLQMARESVGLIEREDLAETYKLPATACNIGKPFKLNFLHSNADGNEFYWISVDDESSYDSNKIYQVWLGNELGYGTLLTEKTTLADLQKGIVVVVHKDSIDFFKSNRYPKTIYIMEVDK